MAAVRKRSWIHKPTGEKRTAWVVDYTDSGGVRRNKQFAKKKAADDFRLTAGHEVRLGIHTADSQSITIKKAGELWIERARRDGLEPLTIDDYERHLRLHINPLLGTKKLSQFTKPQAEAFRDTLVDTRSKAMASKILKSLTGLITEAERRGLVAQNVARGVTVKRSKRERAKVEIPKLDELRAMVDAALKSPRKMDAPLVTLTLFAGLRASELRGLRWCDLDLKHGTVTVNQRADRLNTIGAPKSEAGQRTVPLASIVVVELKKWKLKSAPKADTALVFPSAKGTPFEYRNLMTRHYDLVQIEAGVTAPKLNRKGKPVKDGKGQPVLAGKYGLHALRHAAASFWIAQNIDLKRLQVWIGHADIGTTLNTYGHLIEARNTDSAVIEAVEQAILGGGAAPA